MSAMNFSADPCDDFYNYACGGFERDNEIPDAESSWGQFDILNLANDNVLKKLVNDPKTKLIYKDVSIPGFVLPKGICLAVMAKRENLKSEFAVV